VGQGVNASHTAPPWPSPHCACTAGCPPRGRGTDAKVCPPSIHLPRTLAPPYKWNPHPHLPVRRHHGDLAPVHRERNERNTRAVTVLGPPSPPAPETKAGAPPGSRGHPRGGRRRHRLGPQSQLPARSPFAFILRRPPEPGATRVENQVLTVTVPERHGRRPASSPTRRRHPPQAAPAMVDIVTAEGSATR
jgi:hypothetical protein